MTITRNCTGTTSSRFDVSPPITCIGARQQGQLVSSGAIVTSMCGRWAGSTIGAALISALACARRVLPVLSRLAAGKGSARCPHASSSCSGSSFSEQRPNHALQLPHEVALPIHLRQRMVARGDRSVALAIAASRSARVAATGACSASISVGS